MRRGPLRHNRCVASPNIVPREVSKASVFEKCAVRAGPIVEREGDGKLCEDFLRERPYRYQVLSVRFHVRCRPLYGVFPYPFALEVLELAPALPGEDEELDDLPVKAEILPVGERCA
jgi:hypothetical protein